MAGGMAVAVFGVRRALRCWGCCNGNGNDNDYRRSGDQRQSCSPGQRYGWQLGGDVLRSVAIVLCKQESPWAQH
jgi:hypothetical protein